MMMKAKTLLGVILFATVSLCTRAQGVVSQFVCFSPESDGVSLANATIGYSQQEYEGVKIAIKNLQNDGYSQPAVRRAACDEL